MDLVRITIHGNLIKEAVTRKLRSLIGVSMPIYVEQILQDFQEPCLFVYEISASERAEMPSVYWEEHKIEVKYYADPNSETRYADCAAMGEAIRRALALIDVETWVDGSTLPTRAIRPEWRLFDGYGVYYATYRLRCKVEPQESPLMAQKEDALSIK